MLTIEAIRDTEAPLISADISPRTATFDKKEDKQQDVTMNVTWNDASSITDVTVNGESIGEAPIGWMDKAWLSAKHILLRSL
ncbi:hypothetical protein D1872_334670 [compost metagenome]